MTKKQFLTLLSTAAISAVAAVSVPVTAVVAAPGAESKSSAKKFTNSRVHRATGRTAGVAYDGGIKGYRGDEAGARARRSTRTAPQVVNYKSATSTARHDAVLGARRRRQEALQLRLRLQRLRRRAERRAGRQAARDARRARRSRRTWRCELDTSTTPAFLGLERPGGVWATTGARARTSSSASSTAASGRSTRASRTAPAPTATRPRTASSATSRFPAGTASARRASSSPRRNCNQKLIGARYYNAGWGGNAGIDAQLPVGVQLAARLRRPRHAHRVDRRRQRQRPGDRRRGGVRQDQRHRAARAHRGLQGRAGQTADRRQLLHLRQRRGDRPGRRRRRRRHQLLDQRLADQLPRRRRRSRSCSPPTPACSSPPRPATAARRRRTVAHPGPWLTTVAAGTHNRDGQGSVTLGNGVDLHRRVGGDAARPRAARSTRRRPACPAPTRRALALCFAASTIGHRRGTPALDPAKVAGKIVVCDRGVNARVNKSLAVQEAGGVGMVLLNTPAATRSTPTSTSSDGAPAVTPTAPRSRPTPRRRARRRRSTQATIVFNAPAPLTAAFSSRGPLRAGGGDLLKPDVIAPGRTSWPPSRLRATAASCSTCYSGTSMSSPHVAGLAALFKELHPNWSPMMIKSALMTTGTTCSTAPATRTATG